MEPPVPGFVNLVHSAKAVSMGGARVRRRY